MRIAAATIAALLLAACGGGDESRAEGLIAFASNRGGDFDIYVMRPDGTGVRLLTIDRPRGRNEADDQEPAWSPDGRWIAFTSTRDHKGDGVASQDIYFMNADGGRVSRLTSNARPEGSPTWTPDGRIAFWRCLEGIVDCALVAIDPIGQERERTLFTSAAHVVGASISPDGSTLAFTRWSSPDQSDADVYVAALDGGTRRQLTEAGGFDVNPVWSPDGQTLVFLSDRDRNGRCIFHDCVGWKPELYVIDADGGDERRLTETDDQEVSPSWSPDGDRIVFARIRDDTDDYELFVMDADGGEPRQLTDNDSWDWMPDWYAPDG